MILFVLHVTMLSASERKLKTVWMEAVVA